MIKVFIKKIINILSLFSIHIFNKIGLIDQYINFLYRYNKNKIINIFIYFLKINLKNSIFDIKSKNKYKILNKNEVKKYINKKISSKNIMVTSNVIGFAKKSYIELEDIDLNIYHFKDATITYKSDIIRLEKECYWYKFNHHFMYKTIPADNNLIAFKNYDLLLRTTEDIINKEKIISLIGAVDGSWSHFVIQYLPKLIILKKYYSNENITLVLSSNLDKNCRELVDFAIPPKWKIFEVNEDISIKAKELIYIDNTSWITDHSNTLILGDIILYEIALKSLKEIIINYKESKALKHITNNKNKRIYLRRVSTYRSLLNYEEVDKLLEKYDFEIIYPHLYSLEEKINIFSEAEIIIGPLSSGFVNLIFCNNKTNIIAFLNKNRVWDTYLSTMTEYFGINNFQYLLSDYTENIEDPHSSYTIDIKVLEEEIKRCLK